MDLWWDWSLNIAFKYITKTSYLTTQNSVRYACDVCIARYVCGGAKVLDVDLEKSVLAGIVCILQNNIIPLKIELQKWKLDKQNCKFTC